MSVYQRDPGMLPDSEFEAAELSHLVVGNTGRMLDPRRTPVSVVGVRADVGFVVLRIDAFEDAGATWEIPFERIVCYQFARGAARASDDDVARFRAAVERLDRTLEVPCDPAARAATDERLAAARAEADGWLAGHSRFCAEGRTLPDPETRRGDPALGDDLRRYMTDRGLADVETAFARQFVSGPHAGEIVKGHQVVLAELGLVPYEGKVLRDPATFEGDWTRDRRAAHVLARLGFVRALFGRLGHDQVELYRGLCSEREPLGPPRNNTFVSASFSRAVAESHFEAADTAACRLLLAQAVPVERVFMTYHETAEMNGAYLEAEAALLFDGDNILF